MTSDPTRAGPGAVRKTTTGGVGSVGVWVTGRVGVVTSETMYPPFKKQLKCSCYKIPKYNV